MGLAGIKVSGHFWNLLLDCFPSPHAYDAVSGRRITSSGHNSLHKLPVSCADLGANAEVPRLTQCLELEGSCQGFGIGSLLPSTHLPYQCTDVCVESSEPHQAT